MAAPEPCCRHEVALQHTLALSEKIRHSFIFGKKCVTSTGAKPICRLRAHHVSDVACLGARDGACRRGRSRQSARVSRWTASGGLFLREKWRRRGSVLDSFERVCTCAQHRTFHSPYCPCVSTAAVPAARLTRARSSRPSRRACRRAVWPTRRANTRTVSLQRASGGNRCG